MLLAGSPGVRGVGKRNYGRGMNAGDRAMLWLADQVKTPPLERATCPWEIRCWLIIGHLDAIEDFKRRSELAKHDGLLSR